MKKLDTQYVQSRFEEFVQTYESASRTSMSDDFHFAHVSFFSGIENVDASSEAAFARLSKLSKKGHVNARAAISCYFDWMLPRSEAKDLSVAAHTKLVSLANAGDPDANYWLFRLIGSGSGTRKSFPRALEHLRAAAVIARPIYMRELAEQLENTKTQKLKAEACVMYLESARAGDVRSRRYLTASYATGSELFPYSLELSRSWKSA
jgi:TPR repeat protein